MMKNICHDPALPDAVKVARRATRRQEIKAAHLARLSKPKTCEGTLARTSQRGTSRHTSGVIGMKDLLSSCNSPSGSTLLSLPSDELISSSGIPSCMTQEFVI
jgi:hypothetical protein